MTSIWLESKFSVVYLDDASGNSVENAVVATDLHNLGDSVMAPITLLTSWVTSDQPTYAELSALPVSKAGWQPIFDQWKAKGIVS